MREAVIAVVSVVALVLVAILSFGTTQSEAHAAPGDDCILQLNPLTAVILCDGQVVGRLPLPTVKVSIKGPIVRVPGPTQTITVHVPGETRIVKVPGATITKTQNVVVPGPTKTIAAPRATQTVTAPPRAVSVPTATATVTATTTTTTTATPRVQHSRPRMPTVERPGFFESHFIHGHNVIVKAGIGLMVLIILTLLILLAMYIGYILGFKDKEQAETRFMRSLLEQAKLRH